MNEPTPSLGQHFSLLNPDPNEKFFTLAPNTRSDLSIGFLADQIGHDPTEKSIIDSVLARIPTNPATIAYRNAVYSELSAKPEMCSKLHEIFLWMRSRVHDSYIKKGNSLLDLLWRLNTLRCYAYALRNINELIADTEFQSEGLKKLKTYVAGICKGSGFIELEQDIGRVLKDLDDVRSITIGVNLDEALQPVESGIVSLNSFYFTQQSMIKNFLNFHRTAKGDTINTDPDLQPFNMVMHKVPPGDKVAPLMKNLNDILTSMLPSMTSKVKKVISKYADISGKILVDLTDEFLFYTRFIELEERVKKSGLPCCTATTSADDSEFTNLYNIKLAICHAKGETEESIVCNDLSFTKERNIHILTGPNRGGKTIITQALGLAFIMYQSGVFVPASSASLRPCSGIFTHFPVEEERTVSLGRLGEESARFNAICQSADSDSLILFNESFATTSHTESLYIAEDVIKYLCCLGTRAFFNTHMHELAEHADEFAKTPGAICGVDSLVMDNENGKRSYKMVQKKPDGQSYAREIAYQYGITFEQLSKHLKSSAVTKA